MEMKVIHAQVPLRLAIRPRRVENQPLIQLISEERLLSRLLPEVRSPPVFQPSPDKMQL